MDFEVVQDRGINCRWLVAGEARQGSAFGSVTLACSAEAAEKVDLERRSLRELIGRQFRRPLIKIVGDAHRTNRVRGRWSRSHFVELIDKGHHWPLSVLDHLQVRIDWLGPKRWGGCRDLAEQGRGAAADCN